MRIALVNPNTTRGTTAMMAAIAAEAAGSDVRIDAVTARFGAPLITDPGALDVAGDAVADLAPDLAAADAVIVSAFGDPGLDRLRARLAAPVTGIAEAAMAEAAGGGRRFAVVTTTPALAPRIADAAARYRHPGFCGTWTTPGDPTALTADADALADALAAAIGDAVAEGGADAVVIGGGPLAVAARSLAATSPVPLVEPIPAAVRLTFGRLERQART